MYRMENKEDVYHWFNVENPFNLYAVNAFCGGGEHYGYNDVTINTAMDIIWNMATIWENSKFSVASWGFCWYSIFL